MRGAASARMKLIVVLLGLAACGTSEADNLAAGRARYEQQLATYRPLIEQRRAKLIAVQRAASAGPALTPLDPRALSGSYTTFDQAADLTDTAAPDAKLPPGCHLAFDAFEAFEPEPPGLSYNRVSAWERTAGSTLALVCVQTRSDPLEFVGSGYRGATSRGECRVFALDTAAYLGGFAVDASASSSYRSVGDLEESVAREIADTIESAIPALTSSPSRVSCSW